MTLVKKIVKGQGFSLVVPHLPCKGKVPSSIPQKKRKEKKMVKKHDVKHKARRWE